MNDTPTTAHIAWADKWIAVFERVFNALSNYSGPYKTKLELAASVADKIVYYS